MVFSLHYVQTANLQQRKMQVNRWQFRLQGAFPNGAHPGLHLKPLDAAIGRVLASHRRGGRHGSRIRPKTQNTNKKLFLAS